MTRPVTDHGPAWRLELATLPNAAPWARHHTADVLTRWGLAELADTACLLVTELISNAVRHARPAGRLSYPDQAEVGRITLMLSADRHGVWVQVWDPDPTPPRLRHADVTDESGRGLMLVDQLAAKWNYYRPKSGGKVVWAQCVVETP